MRSLDSAALTDQVLDCFPSGSYALSALLRLMDIEASTEVPTAAVECKRQPRMLINPEFVAAHAPTPEKLLMLVMHELHHVLLGHTTLFPTLTPVQNFVFDCVINALLCRMFPAPEYVAFFGDLMDSTQFPHCLLGPPADWGRATWSLPTGIKALPQRQRRAVGDVYRALYSDTGATYLELYEILPRYLTEESIHGVPLLGSHHSGGALSGPLERRSPVLFDLVRSIVEEWPQPPDPIRGRSLSDLVTESTVNPRTSPGSRSLLRELIGKVADHGASGRIRRTGWDTVTVDGPLPAFSRRTAVQAALGLRPLLQPNTVPQRRRVDQGQRVHVYLDVSGSMNNVRSALYGAILDSKEWIHPRVHLFSGRVVDVTLREMRAGRCVSDNSTAIECVAQHIDAHRVKRALIVTDGFVGTPTGAHREVLKRIRLAVAYVGHNWNATDLAEVANFTRRLPQGV